MPNPADAQVAPPSGELGTGEQEGDMEQEQHVEPPQAMEEAMEPPLAMDVAIEPPQVMAEAMRHHHIWTLIVS